LLPVAPRIRCSRVRLSNVSLSRRKGMMTSQRSISNSDSYLLASHRLNAHRRTAPGSRCWMGTHLQSRYRLSSFRTHAHTGVPTATELLSRFFNRSTVDCIGGQNLIWKLEAKGLILEV
jgi:hypothetical protein